MSANILWSCFADADCDSFNVYRAITGIVVSFPNSLVTGDVLSFSATSMTPQNITIGATDITSVAAAITAQGKGVSATVSNSGTKLLIRAIAPTNPVFRLSACTFATHTSQTPRSIGPAQEFLLINNTAFVSGTTDYSFSDLDGNPLDWYQVTSVKSSVESIPSLPMAPLAAPTGLCVLTGRVVDFQNRPVSGTPVEFRATPHVAENGNSGIVYKPHLTVYTDAYGRWAIPLIQEQTVLLTIQVLGYNQVVQVPVQNYALFQDLVPVDDQLYDQDLSSFNPSTPDDPDDDGDDDDS